MAKRRIERDFDAIVVGSGITGGWAAKELCERGLRTLVLEAGRDIDPARDYTEHVPPWDMHFRGLGDRRATEARQQVQRHSVSFDELSHVFWTDDVDNPYSTPADNHSIGFARVRLVVSPSFGDARFIGGAISISKQTFAMGSASTGRFATPTSLRGTTTSSASSASAAKLLVFHICPTACSNLRWR